MASELSPLMELPILPLRTMVLFPHAAVPMTLNRPSASKAVAAAGLDGLVAVVTQAHPEAETPAGSDLYAVGTGAVVRQLSEAGNDTAMVILEGIERIAIVEVVQIRPYLRARVRRLASERPPQDPLYSAVRANLLNAFDELVKASAVLPDELGAVARSIADDSALADMIASALVESAPATRQDILAPLNVRRRMDKLHELLLREIQGLKIRDQLRHAVQEKIAGAQKEMVLREQLKAIKRELGEESSNDRQLAEGRTTPMTVDPRCVEALLGPPKFRVESQVAERTRRPGVAVAVAWTPAGGDVLFVECSKLPHGRGDVTLTGQMGDVMQESARTAVSWVRAHAKRYGIAEDELRTHDLHIHVPAGAVPKDGPSAGIVMVTALVSLLTGKPVEPRVAMTGELTLSGVVLPIGGIKEKVLAARRSGIRRLIVPADNEPNLREEVPEHLRGDVEIRLASTIEDAIQIALPGEHTMAQEKVQDIMTKQVHCVGEGASVRQVAKLMRDQNIGDVLVTDADGKLCGIVTDRDVVIRAVAEGKDLDMMRVADICSHTLVTVEPSSPVDDAIRLMREKAIRRIPVVDHDQPIGIVSIGDLAQVRDPNSALGHISRAAPNN
jgi:ATP-dependent Lon protease